jgi:hypothetical protein
MLANGAASRVPHWISRWQRATSSMASSELTLQPMAVQPAAVSLSGLSLLSSYALMQSMQVANPWVQQACCVPAATWTNSAARLDDALWLTQSQQVVVVPQSSGCNTPSETLSGTAHLHTDSQPNRLPTHSLRYNCVTVDIAPRSLAAAAAGPRTASLASHKCGWQRRGT